MLSQGGKEILIKAVAMALPIYAMSCFRLPKATCDKLTSAMTDFWWNSREEKRKIHWVSWEKLCLSKIQGGLGFKDIAGFNQTLLGKQAWKVIQDPDCLLSRLLKSKYFDDSDFFTTQEGRRPSFGWRGILHGKELLQMGLKKKIGDVRYTFVWSEQWIGGDVMRMSLMKNPIIDINMKVEELIDQRSRGWNRTKLEELFLSGRH